MPCYYVKIIAVKTREYHMCIKDQVAQTHQFLDMAE